MQRLTVLIVAKYATINFEMQRIGCIFVAHFKANDYLYLSKKELANVHLEH